MSRNLRESGRTEDWGRDDVVVTRCELPRRVGVPKRRPRRRPRGVLRGVYVLGLSGLSITRYRGWSLVALRLRLFTRGDRGFRPSGLHVKDTEGPVTVPWIVGR